MVNQVSVQDYLMILGSWMERMLIESNKTEFCRILLLLHKQDKLSVRLDSEQQPVFAAKDVEPESAIEELLVLVENPTQNGLLCLLLEKKLEFRMTIYQGKKDLRCYVMNERRHVC